MIIGLKTGKVRPDDNVSHEKNIVRLIPFVENSSKETNQ